MTDEHLLTAAKLREQAARRLEGDPRLLDHTGQVSDAADRSSLSFIETCDLTLADDTDTYSPDFAGTSLGSIIQSTFITNEATRAVFDGNSSALSHFVGVTEQDLDGSALRLPLQLLDLIENNNAPAFILGAGNPNTGKTNTMSELAELRLLDPRYDDYLIVSNSRTWPLADLVVTSAHELTETLIEHRDTPKFVFIDEGSTHFDARTHRTEVANQWTPLAKRFAKIGVDACGIVTHTGKDIHPEAKRLATLSYFKTEKKVVEFFDRWPADAGAPTDRLFNGPVEALEPTSAEPDPNDAAPWSWNLKPQLFSLNLDWDDLLIELRQRGPAH